MNQGTYEWKIERLGKISGSNVWKILASEGVRKSYFNELMSEREACRTRKQYEYIKENELSDKIRSLSHGKDSENRAISAYEFITGNEVDRHPRFMLHPDYKYIGASLDGLVHNPRVTIEVKCPVSVDEFWKAKVYGIPDKHMPQVQLGLSVSNRDANHFIYFWNFKGKINTHIQEIKRNDDYINILIRECVKFNAYLDIGQLPSRYDLSMSAPKVI